MNNRKKIPSFGALADVEDVVEEYISEQLEMKKKEMITNKELIIADEVKRRILEIQDKGGVYIDVGSNGIIHVPTLKEASFNYIHRKKVKEKPQKTGRTTFNKFRILGYIAEQCALTEYRNEGYKAEKVEMFEGLNKRLGFIIMHSLLFSQRKAKELIKFLKESMNKGIPDLIVAKRNELFFVEVKANKSKVNNDQKETIKKLTELGCKVIVRRYSVAFSCTDYKIKKLDHFVGNTVKE